MCMLVETCRKDKTEVVFSIVYNVNEVKKKVIVEYNGVVLDGYKQEVVSQGLL